MPHDWLGQPTETIYERTEEREFDGMVESFWEPEKPSRDAIAHCGTAMLIAGAAVATATDSQVIGAVMAVAGVLVFCMAWAKDKSND